MTEAEWVACEDPTPMLEFLRNRGSSRKFRLFGCATCRRIWHLFTMEESRACVETAERYADGQASQLQLSAAAHRAMNFPWRVVSEVYLTAEAAAETAYSPNGKPFQHILVVAGNASLVANDREEQIAQSDLLRDIVRNPFRLRAFAPSWRTDTVSPSPAQMYESRDFSAMPILADALQDAGCDSADVLDHCRGPGPHVRGCWVVDLVLGNE